MERIDKLLKESEILKNKSESEKFLSEKKRAELETKHLKTTFYLKPLIAGLVLAFAGIPIYNNVIKPIHEAQIEEKEIQNEKLSRSLKEKKDSLDYVKITLSNKEKEINAINTSVKSRDSSLNVNNRKLLGLLNDAITYSNNKQLIESQKTKLEKLISSTEKKEKTILWVDDKPENNFNVVKYLEKQEYKVSISKSTDDALNKIKVNPNKYDYIISDMNRFENGENKEFAGELLYNSLKSLNINTPILFYSAGGSQNEELKSRLSGVLITNDYGKIFKELNLQ